MSGGLLFSFCGYLILVISFGLLAYRVTQNLSDFVLGGRSLSGPIAALSSGASDMSAWLLMGLPGAVYASGFDNIWLPIGLSVGAYLNWLYIAKPLRTYTEFANDSLTVPAFLDNRFLGTETSIRLISALATIIFFIFYISSGFLAGAKLLHLSFGFDYSFSLFLTIAIVLLYTFVGGFLAVSWTDFFQGNFMLLCMLIIPFLVVGEIGGWSNAATILKAQDNALFDIFGSLNFVGILSLLAWGLGYFGQPHILVRFMSVKTEKEIPIARRVCMIWMVLSLIAAFVLGITGKAYYLSDISGVLEDQELIFIKFSHLLLNPWLTGLVLAAIISAIMCAADSQMLAASSAIVEDLYHPFFRPNANQKELMLVSRISVVIMSVIAGAIAHLAIGYNSFVIQMVQFAWSGLGATFGPAVLCALFYREVSPKGIAAGMLTGCVIVILWRAIEFNAPDFLVINEIIPGFIISFLTIYLVTKFDKDVDEKILMNYDEAQKLITTK